MKEYINKITCADSLGVINKFPNNCIDLILIDPPYGMDFQSNYRKEKHLKIENDKDLDWLPFYLDEMKRIIKKNGHFYCFCSHHFIDVFKQEIEKRFNYKSILVWEKNNTGMGDLKGDYAPQHEFIIYCNQGKDLNGRRDSAIIKEKRTGNNLHPTEKPVYLMQYLIEKSSKEGDLVLDCFGGSGTTARACKDMNRDFILIEKEQKYCDIAEKRLDQEVLF